jgi:ketosteroid isomerase-like protein
MAHPNVALIEGAYESFAAGDIASIMEIWTDDIAWHIAGDHPLAGDHEGKEAAAAFLGGVMQQTGGTFRAELQNALADDTNGYSLHKGTASKNGEDLESWEILGYGFRDGKVAEIWSFPYDQRIANRMLG